MLITFKLYKKHTELLFKSKYISAKVRQSSMRSYATHLTCLSPTFYDCTLTTICTCICPLHRYFN